MKTRQFIHENIIFSLVLYKKTRENMMFCQRGGKYDSYTTPVSMVSGVYVHSKNDIVTLTKTFVT